MTITGDELVAAISTLFSTPGELKEKSKDELNVFFSQALMEADARYAIQQHVDDALRLSPGLEELSDMVLQQVYETALPIALSELVFKITGGSSTNE